MAREKKIISKLAGTGKVFDGDSFLWDAPYSLTFYQEFIDGIPGLKDLDGFVKADQFRIMKLVGEELTLHLQDGHKFGFFFRDSSGKIANTTGILTAEGKPIS